MPKDKPRFPTDAELDEDRRKLWALAIEIVQGRRGLETAFSTSGRNTHEEWRALQDE